MLLARSEEMIDAMHTNDGSDGAGDNNSLDGSFVLSDRRENVFSSFQRGINLCIKNKLMSSTSSLRINDHSTKSL